MWDIRYRPLKFADVLGQEGHVQVLKSRLRNGTALDTNYLFWGGAGQGKTTLARILARAVLCQQLTADLEPCNECENCKGVLADNLGAFVEFDAASRGTIEHVRKIVDDLPFAVFGAKKRIYVIDECHRMSKDAQDVMLKPLEEKKLVGLFCTTEPEKVRGAVRSRCEEYAIRKVTREDILGRMKMVLASENVEYEEDAVLTVIDFCEGHVRDVLNKLEMVAQMGPVTVDSVRDRLNLSAVSLYYEILIRIRTATKDALYFVDQACERVTPEEVASGIAEAAMNSFRLANGMSADFTFADKNLGQQAYQIYGDQIVRVAKHFLSSRYVSKVGLICDVVTLASGSFAVPAVQQFAPAPPAPVAPAPAPAPMQAAPPATTLPAPPTEAPPPEALPAPAPIPEAPAPAPEPPAPAPVQAPAPTPPTPPPAPAPVQAAPPPAQKFVPQPKAMGPDVRQDGVGPMGQDPCALGDFDHMTVPTALPANKHNKGPLLFDAGRLREGRDPITPSVWRREFNDLLASIRGAASRGDA